MSDFAQTSGASESEEKDKMAHGAYPSASLIQADDGHLYGVTKGGGLHGFGSVFRISLSGDLTTLFSFPGGDDGARPLGGLIQASDGHFYGTTSGFEEGKSKAFEEEKLEPASRRTALPSLGGARGANGHARYGTVFRITKSGELTTLACFSQEMCYPVASLIQGADGSFYGTTCGTPPFRSLSIMAGFSPFGSIFRLDPSGEVSLIHKFHDALGEGVNQGIIPLTSLLQGSNGTFYGTASYGGRNGLGVVFRLSPMEGFETLHTFGGKANQRVLSPRIGEERPSIPLSRMSDLPPSRYIRGRDGGCHPSGSLVRAIDGNFYGTNQNGGEHDKGTVFRITPDVERTTLHDFAGSTGAYPSSALVQGADGCLYGTTRCGGDDDHGTVFKITTDGRLTTLHHFIPRTLSEPDANGRRHELVRYDPNDRFPPRDGAYPSGSLTEASDRNFYGMTEFGGSHHKGTVYRMTPEGTLAVLVSFSGKSGGGDQAPRVFWHPNSGL